MTGVARVRVPATSANLGPGFDSAGLALAWYDEVEAAVRGNGGDAVEDVEVHVEGEGAVDLRRDERHLVVRAAHAALDRLGAGRPGLSVRCVNRIPHGRGLGSSAAAIVAGVVLGRSLAGCPPDEAAGPGALALAAELEGHPDNVAACLLGGVTFAWSDNGQARATRLDPDPGLAALAVVPVRPLSTRQARGLLPAAVPHADAAANVGRAALLATALTGRLDLLLAATEDRLHQRYRRPAMPETMDLVDRLRGEGFAAVVSGAGPSVLVLGSAGEVAGAGALARTVCPGWDVAKLGMDSGGATLVPSVGRGVAG